MLGEMKKIVSAWWEKMSMPDEMKPNPLLICDICKNEMKFGQSFTIDGTGERYHKVCKEVAFRHKVEQEEK